MQSTLALLAAAATLGMLAQEPPKRAGHDHAHMHHGAGETNGAETFLLGQSSGTVFQPLAGPMPMLMSQAGEWKLM